MDPQQDPLFKALAKLPDVSAPPTLLPGVMTRLRAQAALPWWQRPWITWPRPVQMVSAVLGVGLMALALYLAGWVGHAWSPTWFTSVARPETYWITSIIHERWADLLNSLGGLNQLVSSPWFSMAAGLLLGLYLLCVALGTACYRMITLNR